MGYFSNMPITFFYKVLYKIITNLLFIMLTRREIKTLDIYINEKINKIL